MIGIGLPLIFISITMASYEGIPPDKTDQASALINVARNIGSSIGIALAMNVLAYREQFHQSRLVEHVVPSTSAIPGDLQRMTDYFARPWQLGPPGPAAGLGLDRPAGADAGLVAGLYRRVLGPDADRAAAVPLALILRKVKPRPDMPAGH